MHIEIPQVPFAGCAMDSIEQLPTTSKRNRFVLTFICLFNSYLMTLPLKTKTADKVSMTYMKEIIPKTLYSKYISHNNDTEFNNELLMSVFDSLHAKRIYSNPYYPRGNSRIENVHNFLKRSIAKFMHGSQLKWMTPCPSPHTFKTLHPMLMI